MYSKENNLTNKFLIPQDNLFCQYCNKQGKNLNSLKQHECRCKNNPNKISVKDSFGNSRGWAKGLTKSTDQRVANCSTARIGKSNGWIGKKHSEQTKQKISAALLKYNHGDNQRNLHSKGGWYCGIYFMSTWELAYYIYMVDAGKNISRCIQRFEYEYDNKKHYYTPDFIVDDIIIEIKGKEWPKDLIKYAAVRDVGVKLEVIHNVDFCIDYVQTKYNVKDIKDLYER